MNERIEELAEQANLYARSDSSSMLFENYQKRYTEKFAELIVKECVRVAKDPEWFSESPSNGWRNPINHVCNVMKEHFGMQQHQNIIAGAKIHSDKGYQESTFEKAEAFRKKREGIE